MGRGTPLAQYGSFGGMIQPDRGYGSQQPMISDMAYRGPQQGSPNSLSYARGPMITNPQGPGLGRGLFSALGQLQMPQQMPQQPNPMLQNLVSQLRGMTPQQPMVSRGPVPQPNQPALTPAVMPQQPVSPQLQAAFQAASNQMAGRPDNYVPQGTPAPMPQQPMVNRPPSDPDFNINNAMNTFGRSLNERVQSGQMSVADAQRAQAEMRALQLNPAGATREAATEIAQRNLQVGRFNPENMAAEQRARERAMQTPTPAAAPPTPAAAPPTPAAAPAIPQGWTTAGAYRDFGAQLGNLIKSGKITAQQANALKDPAFQATKLGNTPEAFAAMQKALAGLTGYAAGGYATQVASENPRMQAMRAIQRIGK